MWSDRPCSLHHEIDAAVLRLALVGIVTRDRLRRAIADRAEPVGRQSRLDQEVGNRLGTPLRQPLVGRLVAVGIGMSRYLDIGGRAAQRGFDQAIEQPCGIRGNVGLAGFEADPGLAEQFGE